MATVAVYNIEGKEVDKLELNDNVFGVEINEQLVHKAVVTQLANKRQGTQSAKTRSEVSGGGKKPWRQKGTGHARQGSIRAPQWKGGGVVFAPKPVLTSKVQASKLIVVDELKVDEIKTSRFVEILDNLKSPKALVVTKEKDEKVYLSARNIPTEKTALANTINVYDILKYESLVITKDAVAAIEEVYA